MKLRYLIASTGHAAGAIWQVLDEHALEAVARVTQGPVASTELN